MHSPLFRLRCVSMPRFVNQKALTSSFFPKLERGFWADLASTTGHVRLFAHLDQVRWVTSVYNRRTKEWLAESSAAKNSDDAKRKAEQIGRRLVPGTSQIEWHSIGR